MKEFLGRIKADFLLSSVLCIALGLVFIIWRASVLTIVANVLAVVLIIIGVVYMCSFKLLAISVRISCPRRFCHIIVRCGMLVRIINGCNIVAIVVAVNILIESISICIGQCGLCICIIAVTIL